MKYMRRTGGYTWANYKTNAQVAKELKITPILDKLLEYKRSWIQHVNRMPRNRLPRVMKHYSTTGRRNHGRPLKRLLDTWDRNGSTSGPTPWQIYDDILLLSSLVTSLFFPGLILNQQWSPPHKFQVSGCSTFRIMCDIFLVFCSKSVECFPDMASKFFFESFVTTPVASIITGTIIHFMYHIRCISLLLLLSSSSLLGFFKDRKL